MELQAVEPRDAGVLLRVKLQPKASRDAVLEACPSHYRLALTAPPVDGAANEALIKFLSKVLGIARQQITLASGKQSRTKALHVAGANEATVRRLLEAAIRPSARG